MTNKPTITLRLLGKDVSASSAIDGVLGKLGDLGTLGVAAVGTAGLAIGGALVSGTLDALDQNKVTDKLAAQLNLSGENAERFGSVAGELYADAYGDSFQDATDQLGGIIRTFGEDITDAEAFGLSAGSIDLTSAFDLDPERLQQTAGVVLNNGLADSATEAFDIITAGLQGINAPAGDVLDTLYEFSEPLASLGLEGEAAIGVIANAADAGVFDLTKAGDALKELSIRAIDGSASTAAAYEALGIPADALAESLAAGGPSAEAATSQIIQALGAMTDPIAQEAAGVALFGTTWEDLGPQAIAALDPMLASIESVDGATSALGDSLNDNLSTRFEAIKRQAFQGLATVAETVVLPALEKVIPYIEDFGAELGERLPGYIATAKAAFDTALPVIETYIEFLIDNWPKVSTAISTAIDAIVFYYEEILFPAATFLIEEVFTPIFEWVEENWPTIESVITTVLDDISTGFDTFTGYISDLWDIFGDDIIAVIDVVAETIVPVISGVFDAITGIYNIFKGLFSGDWSLLWNGITGVFSGAWAIAQATITGAFDLLAIGLGLILDGIVAAITGTWDSVVEEVSGLGGRIATAAIGIFDGVKEAFKSAINFIIDGWNGLSFSLPSIDLGLFGSTPAVSISTAGLGVTIPRLATGGALFSEQLFIGGDNPNAFRDPEIVAPQSFIRQAVDEALAEFEGFTGQGRTIVQNITGYNRPADLREDSASAERQYDALHGRFAMAGDSETT